MSVNTHFCKGGDIGCSIWSHTISPLIFQEKLNQYHPNFMQLLDSLFEVGLTIKIFMKNVSNDNIKSHKKPKLYPFLEKYSFEKIKRRTKLITPLPFSWLIINWFHVKIKNFIVASSTDLNLTIYSHKHNILTFLRLYQFLVHHL